MHRTPHIRQLAILHEPQLRPWLVHRIVLALFVVTLFVTSNVTRLAAMSSAVTTPDVAAIDAYIEAQMHEQHIPGLALGIVHGDDIIHLKGFGIAAPTGELVTAQTPFSIGSLTKSFTAVAIMQLVEAGQLELDASVQRYLPWFRVTDQEASAQMTVRHLLNHTSGLPRDFDTTEAHSQDQDSLALEARLRRLRTVQLEQPLGTYGYSNVGYQALAMVIQTVTGRSYEEYIRQHIFVPLDMQHSFATLSAAAQHHMAVGYHYWFGLPVASALPTYQSGPGNGGLFSSAEDMSRYIIMHLNHGHFGAATLLSSANIAEVHRPVALRPDGAYYAMGWNVQTVDGVTLLAHSGQTYNYMAKMVLVPDSQWGVVVLQNSQYMLKLATGDSSQDAIADGVVAMLIGHQPPHQATNSLLLPYGILLLLLVVQLIGMARSIVMLGGWHNHPERRPQGKRRLLWHGAVPLVLNLSWAMLVLIGLPLTNNLTTLGYQIPDVTYTLLTSGIIALGWGIIRMAWTYQLLHRSGTAPNDGRLVV